MTDRVVVTSPSFSQSSQLIEDLERCGVCCVANKTGARLTGESLHRFVNESEANILVVGLEQIDEAFFSACPKIEFVSKFGVGLDNVDLEAAKRRDISIGWTGGVNKRSVVELVIAFTLGHLRNVNRSVDAMRKGLWKKDGGRELSHCTFGIIGFGFIGSDLARILNAFGCNILVYDILNKSEEIKESNAKQVDFQTVLREADVLSFHVPSTNLTRGMLAKDQIKQCKKNCFIVNTSRGDIVNFEEVVSAVKSKNLGGFAADVFPVEPSDLSQFAACGELYFTPHIGGNSAEAVLDMGRSAIQHIKVFLERRK